MVLLDLGPWCRSLGKGAAMIQDAATRRLLAAGVVGPPLFIAVLLLAGATRAGYDPVRHAGSLLSLGDQGWIPDRGLCRHGTPLPGVFAFGLRRAFVAGPGSRWAPILIGGAGVGLIISGIFPTDPGFGYPPGTPPGSPAHDDLAGRAPLRRCRPRLRLPRPRRAAHGLLHRCPASAAPRRSTPAMAYSWRAGLAWWRSSLPPSRSPGSWRETTTADCFCAESGGISVGGLVWPGGHIAWSIVGRRLPAA